MHTMSQRRLALRPARLMGLMQELLQRLPLRLRTLTRSPLVSSILALYGVQGLNYLLPLVVLPYLLRVLGPAPFGAIVFAQSLCNYWGLLTDFGFNLSATRAVSVARADPQHLARLFWSTLAAKALLLAAGGLLLVAVVLAVPELRARLDLIGACSLLVLGNVLLPQWYLQGLERMRSLALMQLVAKAVAVLAVLLWVHSPRDVVRAAVALSLPGLIAGMLSLLSLGRIAPVGWHRPAPADIREALTSSWPLFLASVAGNVYATSYPFLLGLIAGDTAVALYGVGNRISQAAFSLFTPALQAVYPRMSLLFGRSVEEGRAFMRRLLVWLLAPAAGLSLLLTAAAPQIVTWVAGTQYPGAGAVLRILGPLPLLLTLATLATTTLVSLGLTRTVLRIYSAAALLSLVLLPALAILYQAAGAAAALLLVESAVTATVAHAALRGWRES
jgi:polysaccharide transporter, PST family